MSHHILGFAEKLFNTDPRPSALSIEKVIGNFVLLDILFQVILIGYILIDDFHLRRDGIGTSKSFEFQKGGGISLFVIIIVNPGHGCLIFYHKGNN